ncbi:DUF2934 domain-containing protein [Pseudomonas sp. MYb185]|uniref:DUF2934 domain-containing protein n=1 Tax=Pseudomonas sp. MYb185 TaxID=1848729 RepID=UPI000CFC279A|nr:DUF2934 domain-containing protein [Pseudomonas sp. MYb185]PRB80464.1 hypothetical protein CQ007_12105 [Pseudomonas sp. MYb185]
MNNDEQRIRELAYQIWESEGRPAGQEQRHWQMACKLFQSEQNGELQPTPAKKAATRKPRSKAAAAPTEDETQLEKPALLDKPAAAKKPARPRRQAITRTTKITEPGKPEPDQQE